MNFSLIDPFDECQYLSNSLSRMIELAKKTGATRFQLLEKGKFLCHVQQSDSEEWLATDPKYQNCAVMRFSEVRKAES